MGSEDSPAARPRVRRNARRTTPASRGPLICRRSSEALRFRPMRAPLAVLFLTLACTSHASAVQDSPPAEPKKEEAKDEKAPKVFTTQHTGTSNGKEVHYSATVSETILEDE